MNSSALALSMGLLCLWPLFIGFIGFQIGRKRLKFRFPVQINLKPDDSDYDEPDEPTTYQPSLLSRMRNAGSFKK
jgi:hypothetical protein